MKKTILTLMVAGSFAIGSVMLVGCGDSPKPAEEHAMEGEHEHAEDEHEHAEGEEHHEHMEGEMHDDAEEHGEEHVFACPMHPEITGNEGDKCSECGMELEMVAHEHEEDEAEGNDEDGHDHEH